ncbi:hypothetical protein U1Q18_006753 [Sarracenia purpurea var. burkii]
MVKIMPSIDQEDKSFRVLDPLRRNSLRNLAYHKLPQQLLKLSILKLDGSSFDVYVSRNATIAELKQAVEEVFSVSPKDGECVISWSHVWGHFCLCYEGQKLVNDKVHILNFGINDGNELRFIRNMSINYRPVKQRSKIISGGSTEYSMISSGENALEEGDDQTSASTNGNRAGEDENDSEPCHYEDEDEVPVPKFKLAHFLSDRLSYSRLRSSTRKRLIGRNRFSSRFSPHS